jgi:lipoprotein
MIKKTLSLTMSALILSGCGPVEQMETKDSVTQQYEVMISSDKTTYLKKVIYEDELIPLFALINYINEKQIENSSNTRSRIGPRPFTYRFTENSIQSLMNILRPFEGFYTKDNCAHLKDDEFLFYSPEMVAYYTLKNSALDKDSLKAKALAAELEQKIRQMSSNINIRKWIERKLLKDGVKIETDWNAYKRQIKNEMEKSLTDNETFSVFANPNAIFCSPISFRDLKITYDSFLEFNKSHKPLNFNNVFRRYGYYDESLKLEKQ